MEGVWQRIEDEPNVRKQRTEIKMRKYGEEEGEEEERQR